MSAAFDQEFAERKCCRCPCTEQLLGIGHLDYCPAHYREAIADLPLKRSDYETPNNADESDHSGIWRT